MNIQAIKKHILDYYESLYGGRCSCKLPIQKGRALAEQLGYPMNLLADIPLNYWDAFVPCGNPLPYLKPVAGQRILNLGCGSAIDSFALSAVHGHDLMITNADIVFHIVRKARSLELQRSVKARTPFQWLCTDAEALPFAPHCFDWVVMNGVFNLFPDKVVLLGEMKRIVKPNGSLVIADLCCNASLPPYFRDEKDAWAWCMSGAFTPESLQTLCGEMGFEPTAFVCEEDWGAFSRVILSCRSTEDYRP